MCRATLFLLALLGAAACGGGPAETAPTRGNVTLPRPNQPPPLVQTHFEGAWIGTLTSESFGASRSVTMLVNGWGFAYVVGEDFVWSGVATVGQRSFEIDMTGFALDGNRWPDGSRVTRFRIDGVEDEQQNIDARYAGGGDSGTLMLTVPDVPAQFRHMGIAGAAGMWVQRDANGGIAVSVVIDAIDEVSGSLSGSDADGCIYSGALESWTSRDLLELGHFRRVGCPVASEAYRDHAGVAALIDLPWDIVDELYFLLVLSNDEGAFLLRLERP